VGGEADRWDGHGGARGSLQRVEEAAEFEGEVLHADGCGLSVASSSVVPRTRIEEDQDDFGDRNPSGFFYNPFGGSRKDSAKKEVKPPPLPDDWEETKLDVRTEIAYSELVDVRGTCKKTFYHETAVVAPGSRVGAGDPVAEGSSIVGGELSIGKNMVVAYVPFEGYNYEDAICLSARCVREELLTSVHISVVEVALKITDSLTNRPLGMERDVPHLVNGMPTVGTWVCPGDVLVGIRSEFMLDEEEATNPHRPNRRGVYESNGRYYKDKSAVLGADVPAGRIISVDFSSKAATDKNTSKIEGVCQMVTIHIASQCRVQVGDKLAGRHGNKGIVAKIMDDRDMPYLPDGTPVDVCLNPLGVPSRMNVGQIFECLLGTAGKYLGQEYRVAPFDEMFAEEASRGLVFDALRRARDSTGLEWIFDPTCPGKTRIFDGRTGYPLDQPVTAGVAYILKLNHLVKDKVYARSSGGAYSSITCQPLQGRASGGGMRVGEMEVSALIGYGAHATLQEMMTVKSDDPEGRIRVRKALERGEDFDLPEGGTSEGYLTFQREIASSGFVVSPGRVGGSS